MNKHLNSLKNANKDFYNQSIASCAISSNRIPLKISPKNRFSSISQVKLRKIVLTCLQIYQAIFGYIHLICSDLKAIFWRESTPIGIPFLPYESECRFVTNIKNSKCNLYDDYRIGSDVLWPISK